METDSGRPVATHLKSHPNRPEPSRTDLSRTHTDLSGTYTLTLSASSRCRLELPEDLRTRPYTATIVQAGGSLMVTVQYPSPWSWGQPDRFAGWFGGTHEVMFQLGHEEWWLEGASSTRPAALRARSPPVDSPDFWMATGRRSLATRAAAATGSSRARLRTTAWCFRGDRSERESGLAPMAAIVGGTLHRRRPPTQSALAYSLSLVLPTHRFNRQALPADDSLHCAKRGRFAFRALA